MNIDLGKYVITSDNCNFILNTKYISKEGKRKGETLLSAESFHGTWKSLTAKLLELEILSADADSLQDILNVLSCFSGVISDKLAQLSGATRPSEQGVAK